MGESMVESPNFGSKMGESMGSHSPLEVSISFGRFDNDNSLSWDKWSSFSQNKYLEEVEKCSTPGSVAQKKAYFEAHYKKIAARKIEILEQETNPSTSNELNCQHVTQNTPAADVIDPSSGSVLDERKDDTMDPLLSDDLNRKGRTENIHQLEELDEQIEDDFITLECNNSFLDEGSEELTRKVESREINEPDEAASVKEETPVIGFECNVTETPKFHSRIEHTPKKKVETLKLQQPIISQKVNPVKKERKLVGTNKKMPESSTPRPTKTSAVKASKPPPTTPTSRSLIKKANVSSLPKSKNSIESKQVGPTSLHMSISMGSVNSDSASVNTTRSSLIMETMGDKDIVKRAFKSFQNSFNQQANPSSSGKLKGSEQVMTRVASQNVSNERTRKSTEKINPQRGQLGKTWNSASSGSTRETSFNGGNVKTASVAIGGLKSSEKAEKNKKIFKKFEDKSHPKASERTHLTSKAKDEKEKEKEKEMRKLRQSMNFKAKPMPEFYGPRGISTRTTPSRKEDAKRGENSCTTMLLCKPVAYIKI